MRARTLTAPVPPPAAVVGAEISALLIVGALTTAGVSMTWPLIAAVAVIVAAAATIRVHGRHAAGWALWWGTRRRRHHRAAQIPQGLDVRRGDQVFGILRDTNTATAVLEICGSQYAPTVLSGPGHAVTSNTLPLQVLAEQLIQPGPLSLEGIDLVDTGFRVRRAQGYPPLYSTVLNEHPARGNVTTYAVVRVNIPDSAHGLLLRTTVEDAAAAVAERLICALQEQHCRARPLALDAVNTLVDDIAGPLLAGTTAVHSRYLNNDGDHWATYVYPAEDISATNLNSVWSWRVDSAVTTVTLRRTADGEVAVSALVRTHTPQPPTLSPAVYLNTPVGDQYRAAMAAVPGGPRIPDLPAATLADLNAMALPIGAAGVMIGTVEHQGRRQPVLMPLTDPEHATRVLMNTGIMYARQMLLRAAAVGHPISVYTDTPHRWAGLQDLEPFIEIHQNPAAIPALKPDIVVKDRKDGASQSTAPTIISMPTDSSYPKGLAPDISFTQIDDHRIAVRTGHGQTKVTIATFPDEQPYLFAHRSTRV